MAQAATPTFSPTSGDFASGPVVVTITSATSGATIYYTTDGSTPTDSSSSIVNGGTVSLAASTFLKAIASHAGDTDSDITQGTYVVAPQRLQEGTVIGGQNLTPFIESTATSTEGTDFGTGAADPLDPAKRARPRPGPKAV